MRLIYLILIFLIVKPVVCKAQTQHSLACMQGINCNSVNYLPSTFQNEISRSVVRINACAACTGTILAQAVENTNELEYLLLTARHCIHEDLVDNGSLGMGLGPQCSLNEVKITFNFLLPDCNSQISDPEHWKYFSNCTLIAEDLNSDLALLRLETPPPVWFRPYFAGWSVLPQIGNSTGPFYCIHHPAGREKAIAKSSSATVLQVIPSVLPPEVFNLFGAPFLDGWLTELIDRYYLIWTEGLIQRGSSGAALFNSNEKVIAGLSVGLITPPYCDDNDDANDFATFGQLMNFVIDHSAVRNALDKTGNTIPALSVDGTEILCYEHDLNLFGEIWPASEYQINNAVTINSSGTIFLGRNNNGQTESLTIKNGSEYYFNAQSGVEIDYIEEDPNQIIFEVSSNPCIQRVSQQKVIRGNYNYTNKDDSQHKALSSSNSISITPNPSSDFINIKSMNKMNSLALLNAVGEQVVFYNNMSLYEYQIDVTNFAKGIYMLVIGSDGFNETRKVLISENQNR
jgi:hypothetical protein